MTRDLVLAACLWALAQRAAWAGECSNPCGLPAGGVCTSLFRKGEGFERGLLSVGQVLRLHAGRQRGTCGGLEELRAEQVGIQVGREPQGLFQPLPGGADSVDDQRPLWRPQEAGDYFVVVAPSAAHQPQDEDRLFVSVVGPRAAVALRITPPGSGGWLTVRRAPLQAAAALQAGFGRRRWPVVYQGSAARAVLPLELAPGPYEVEWARERGKVSESALGAFQVSGAGELHVKLPRPTVQKAGAG